MLCVSGCYLELHDGADLPPPRASLDLEQHDTVEPPDEQTTVPLPVQVAPHVLHCTRPTQRDRGKEDVREREIKGNTDRERKKEEREGGEVV